MKTEKAETQHIIDMVTKIAMVNPQIKFSLTINGQILFERLPCKNYIERLTIIKGKEFKENIIEISTTKGDIEITGYAGILTYNRTSANLYLFVNKRPVRDSLLISAVKAAYQDFIPHGRYPIAVLYLTLPHQMVDVNVHPTKAEVRFQDKNLIRSFVVNELKLAIKKSIYQATSETRKTALDYFTDVKTSTYNNNVVSEHNKQPMYTYAVNNTPNNIGKNISNNLLKIEVPNNIEQQVNISNIKQDYPLGERTLSVI